MTLTTNSAFLGDDLDVNATVAPRPVRREGRPEAAEVRERHAALRERLREGHEERRREERVEGLRCLGQAFRPFKKDATRLSKHKQVS